MEVVADSVAKGVWVDNVSWAAYDTDQPVDKHYENVMLAVIALLPLFDDNAHSVAMVKHDMEYISNAVHK